MTLPEWDEPEPTDVPSGSLPGDDPGAGPAETAPEETASEADDLAEKPVLEWTNEDWARWIASGAAPPLPQPSAASEDLAGAAGAATEPEAGGDPPEPVGEAAPVEVDEVGEAAPVEVDEVGEAAPVEVDEAAEAAPVEVDEAAEAAPVEVDEVPEAAVGAPAAVVPAAGHDDQWAGVADHPWWESAPVTDPEPTVVARASAPAPAPRPESPGAASALAGVTTRPTRAMPAARFGPPGGGRVHPVGPDASHRVRSAFGLVGVAVMVGMVMAGLVTVAIFAITLALRRAVG